MRNNNNRDHPYRVNTNQLNTNRLNSSRISPRHCYTDDEKTTLIQLNERIKELDKKTLVRNMIRFGTESDYNINSP
jgi:hypothetical protein